MVSQRALDERDRAQHDPTHSPFCPPFTPMVNFYPEREEGPDGLVVEPYNLTARDVETGRLASIAAQDMTYGIDEALGSHPGRYVRMTQGNPHNGIMWMNDTPRERETCLPIVEHARGDVLVVGMGIGMVLVPLLENDAVEWVHVIDISIDVINLVNAPARFAGVDNVHKLTVGWSDARSYPALVTTKFHAIWLDIWPNVSVDHFPEYSDLLRRYRRLLRPGGWIGAWRWDTVKAEAAKRSLRLDMARRSGYR